MPRSSRAPSGRFWRLVGASAAGGGTPPLEALLAGLRLALGAGNRAEQKDALAGVADWPAVSDLMEHHRVSELFLRGLRSEGIPLPHPTVERLAERRARNARRGLRQLKAMRRSVAALSDAGIPSLILKGLPLGKRLYGQPLAKTSVDVDLLVPTDAFVAAGGALDSLGWRRVIPGFRETPARMRWYDSVQKEHVYVGAGSKIELHQRLLGNRFLFNPPFASLHAGGLEVAIGRDRFRTLSDADHLLYLACHGALHYWQRLKWLCDFAALLRRMSDGSVERATARGRHERLDIVLATALRLLREDLGVETPAAAATFGGHRATVRFLVAVARRAWTPHHGLSQLLRKAEMRLGRIFIGTGLRYRLNEVRGLLIRHHDFNEIDLPDRLFCLYLPLQPVLGVLRILRRQA